MPFLTSDEDFRARMDLEALETAEQVKKDPSRQRRIRSMVRRERETLDRAEARVTPEPRGFNGAVKSRRRR